LMHSQHIYITKFKWDTGKSTTKRIQNIWQQVRQVKKHGGRSDVGWVTAVSDFALLLHSISIWRGVGHSPRRSWW
jgi:hypothetical protein